MRRLFIILALTAALLEGWHTPARADNVGAVIGGVSGFFLAGPPGAIVGVIVGEVFGKPFWGPARPDACWIDQRFHRHCPEHNEH
jgi:hypothetical protein